MTALQKSRWRGRPDYTAASVVPELNAEVCKPQQGRGCEASVVNRENAGSTLEHVLYSFVIPRGTKDLPILPKSVVGEVVAIEILAWST